MSPLSLVPVVRAAAADDIFGLAMNKFIKFLMTKLADGGGFLKIVVFIGMHRRTPGYMHESGKKYMPIHPPAVTV